MSAAKRQLIESLWRELAGTRFDVRRFAQGVVHDAGVDIGDLREADIRRLYEASLCDNWGEVAFAFNEMLACYTASPVSHEEFVRAVFVALYLSEAIARGHGEWSLSFDKVLKLIAQNLDKGDEEFRLAFFRALLAAP